MLHRLAERFRCDLAVDLGTTTTRVGVVGEGLVLEEPSVVAVGGQGGRVLGGGCAVGHLAKQMEGRTPESIRVVRPLRHGVIADFELAEAMLRYFLRKARPPGWRRKPRVLVGIPGSITPVEKRAVLNSLQRAGARQVLLLDSAKAVAVGAGLPIAEPLASMICQIGGGTTEVAVMSLADTVAARSIRTAGDEMDQALVDYLRRHFRLRIGVSAAERLRVEAGNAYPQQQERSVEISGLDTVSGLPRRTAVTTEEIRQALADPLAAIVETITLTLDGLSPELAADLMSAGLVLSGGAALLAGLDRFIAQQTGLPIRMAAEPTQTVAQGLLVCLEHLDQWRHVLQSSDDEV